MKIENDIAYQRARSIAALSEEDGYSVCIDMNKVKAIDDIIANHSIEESVKILREMRKSPINFDQLFKEWDENVENGVGKKMSLSEI